MNDTLIISEQKDHRMPDLSLYNEILELITHEAELDNYTFLTASSLKGLHTDFPAVRVDAVNPIQKSIQPLQAPVNTIVQMPPPIQNNVIPQVPGQNKPIPQQAPVPEAKPIAAANIDLSSITAKSLGSNTATYTQLYTGDHFTISGNGDANASLMFIGEAQGRGDDQVDGNPSQLLTKMIEAMKLSRQSVYISDICHRIPIDNPQTIDKELGICISYLQKQIEVVKPQLIVFLGPLPLRLLLNKRGISKHRGQWLEYMGAKVMPTFHPAILLREPPRKRDTWADLQAVMKELETPTS